MSKSSLVVFFCLVLGLTQNAEEFSRSDVYAPGWFFPRPFQFSRPSFFPPQEAISIEKSLPEAFSVAISNQFEPSFTPFALYQKHIRFN